MQIDEPAAGVPHTVRFDTGRPGPQVAVVGMMHGNEPVGGLVLDQLRTLAPELLTRGSLLLVRANPVAESRVLRHTEDGVDLNRLWDRRTLERLGEADPSELCYEERRVLELAPLLIACDAILDLHSTSRPSPQSLLFRDDQRHAQLARQLDVEHLITGVFHGNILSGGMCSNAGLQPGERSERLGLTFEAGEHTDPGNAERALQVTERFLTLLEVWDRPLAPARTPGRVYEVVDRFLQAPAGTTPYRFVGFQGGEVGSVRRGPPRELASFEEIEADEMLLRRGSTEVVRAPAPFTMLMPAPTADPGTDLFYFTQERHGGLADGGVRTHAVARQEAAAIERMLDLLADDELARGTTLVSFHGRQILDMCAEMVGRGLRLRVGDPHRRITVVGSGDFGGDETERRAGYRYRQAMRLAMRDGIRIERVQLLRGASLGWLDMLTSGTVLRLVSEREDPVRLALSIRQPQITSILVVGDLERALATGETRHVRAGLIVEAAMVEPHGPRVRTHVVRSAVFSNRPEFLATVHGLLLTLEGEHRSLIRSPSLAEDPSTTTFLVLHFWIEARPDPESLRGLRYSLQRLQLGLWSDVLRHELPEPVWLPDEEAVGRWLAATMASTGILDGSALRALLVSEHGTGWVADPERLERAIERRQMPRESRSVPRATPARPILSQHVDADTLEHWIGWKRFVRSSKPIPGERGKDVELALTEEAIQARVSALFGRVRRLADRNPGDVMVVLAGDGLSPLRERHGAAWDVVLAHRALLRDPNLRYLRIQHSRGGHLPWIKDLAHTLESRTAGQPVILAWEAEHGAVVNMILVCEREPGTFDHDPYSLASWNVTQCSLLLSDLRKSGGGYKVALFTGQDSAQVNQELLHFGRSHCEGLLRQAGSRLWSAGGTVSTREVEAVVVRQIAGWLGRVRDAHHDHLGGVEPGEDVSAWVAEHLGIADPQLARALAEHRDSRLPVEPAARLIWDEVEPWPGRLWTQLHYGE